MTRFLLFASALILTQAAGLRAAATDTDPYLWLEDVDSPTALKWVADQNAKTLPVLQKDPRYNAVKQEIAGILLAPDRLPQPEMRGSWIYNFWQDAEHVRGIWRRTPPSDFGKAAPRWDTVFDLDQLSAQENENWVWKGAICLEPEETRCLVNLSRGGRDAVVIREFDTETRDFVPGGFVLPEAKSDIAWRDKDTLLVGTDFGTGSLTQSGYSRFTKLWKRGTPLTEAKVLLEGKESDVELTPFNFTRPEGKTIILSRGRTFYATDLFLLDDKDKLVPVPVPEDADLKGVFDGEILLHLRSDWKTAAGTFSAGQVVALPIPAIGSEHPEEDLEVVYAPDATSAFTALATAQSRVYIAALENVKGRLWQLQHTDDGWKATKLNLPDNGAVSLSTSSDFEDRLIVSFESFLTPPSLYSIGLGEQGSPESRALLSLAPKFDTSDLVVEQRESVSADGTKVPYFLVHRNDQVLDGNNPTLLYGYGGFEISETPFYLSHFGKVWLERGGTFALANIRGGGEFGPKWHEAALTTHRQRAYDDFASIARDLIQRKVTSPRRLGIRGGSNGGLLMGVAFTEHPELYNAVVCEVGLLDMLRYSKMLAGASWIGEYGDPEDPKMAAVIRKYSPYQNVRPNISYPKVFFLTSTADDRVDPAHSRKMVAKMEAQGHPVLLYENTEGGHGGAATLDEQASKAALEDTYLLQQLFD